MRDYKCANCGMDFDSNEAVKSWGSNLCEGCLEQLFDEEDGE